MKKIVLTTKQAKDLAELLFRGFAYTDMYYQRDKRCYNIYNEVIEQFKAQGGIKGINGSISFKKCKSKTVNV